MPYYDYAATTPIRDEVLAAMLPYQKGLFGNPSSVYAAGREAKKGLEEARELVAEAVGALPSEVIFTGGGTESDNAAIKPIALKRPGAHIVISAIEHHAVLHSAEWLASQGCEVSVVGVDAEGLVVLEALEAILRSDTAVVSIMTVNNETGVIQPMDRIVEIVRSKSRALLHTDAVQALGKMNVDLGTLGVDLASFSAHKVGGPKGTGASFVKRKTSLEPLIHGGGQERDLRSGTPNVAGIVGFGEAARLAAKEMAEEAGRLAVLRDDLQSRIVRDIKGVSLNGAGAPRIPGTLNVCIDGIEGESLLLMLDVEGIAASSGSACTSGSLEPSHVLTAMGVDSKRALGSLRISFGHDSTVADVDLLMQVLPPIVERLRGIGRG